MKNAINRYVNAFVLASLASLTNAQVVQDNQSSVRPTAKTSAAALQAERIASLRAEEKTAMLMEESVMEMVTDTHVVANFARAGITKPDVCKDAASVIAKDIPNLYKQLYADTLDARQTLGGIKQDVKLRRIDGFNMLADFWQSNLDLIDGACTKPVTQTRQLAP